jgi:hypothetical protein
MNNGKMNHFEIRGARIIGNRERMDYEATTDETANRAPAQNLPREESKGLT